jgi:hypothetical protein
MKKVIYLLSLLMSTLMYSQVEVDLSNMTGDVDLGQNCSSSQTPQEFVTTGDVNLNGYEITLRNAILFVTGDLNGDGEIETCGQSQSQICVSGTVSGDVEFEGVSTDCSTLSTPNYNINKLSYSYSSFTGILDVPNVKTIEVYNLHGQQLIVAKGSLIDLSNINTNVILVRTDMGSFKFIK